MFSASALFAGQRSNIVFLSDFGLADDAVSQCKAVIYTINPDAQITDITHQIPPFDIKTASFYLAEGARVWPAGTVFLAVVDPGVGTRRKPIVVETADGNYFVGPDNGIFTLPIKQQGFRQAYEIAPDENVSATFHGRDVFAKAAARLAENPAKYLKNAKPVKPLLLDWPAPVISKGEIQASVLKLDGPYGNVWSDIPAATALGLGLVRGSRIRLSAGAITVEMPFAETFADAAKGEPLAYINSRGLLALAINMGNFSETYKILPDTPIVVSPAQDSLLDLEKMGVKNIKLDIRYATANNFTGKKVYTAQKCYLLAPAAKALARAAKIAAKENLRLCLLDCYRPLAAQKALWKQTPDPRFVANPDEGSKHNRGMAVDITLCSPEGTELPMPTPFDTFSADARFDSPNASPEKLENRARLQKIMKAAGFYPIKYEWWHFNLPGWRTAPVLDIPFEP